MANFIRSFGKNKGRKMNFRGRDFEDSPRVSRRDNRNNEPSMAVCAGCGKECELPFTPKTDKPVFCNECFSKSKGGDSRGDRRESRGSFRSDNFRSDNRSERRSFSREGSDFRSRPPRSTNQRFEATCDKCGKTCYLPFQPTGSKPVYCSNCFEDEGKSGITKEQFEELNKKIDKIMNALNIN